MFDWCLNSRCVYIIINQGESPIEGQLQVEQAWGQWMLMINYQMILSDWMNEILSGHYTYT